MSLDLLGEGFDIHGGGQDLAFPHHENERAQAVADGTRLRPPLGAQRLRRGRRREDVEVARQLHQPARPRRRRPTRGPTACSCCASHYRSPLEVNKATTDDAAAALERLDTFARRVADAGLPASPPDADALDEFRGRDGRRPRHAERGRRCCSRPRRRANRRSTPDDVDAAAPLAAAACSRSAGASGSVLDAGGGEVPDDVAGRWPPSATRPGPPRTAPAPTPCATELAADGLRRRGHARRARVVRPGLMAAAAPVAPVVGVAARPARPLPPGFGVIWTTVAVDLIGFGIVLPILPQYAERLRRRRHGHRPADGVVLAGPADLRAGAGAAVRPHRPQAGPPRRRCSARRVGSFLTGARRLGLAALRRSPPRRRVGRQRVGGPGLGRPTSRRPTERPRLMGLLGAAFGVGFVAGPAIGAPRRARRRRTCRSSSPPPSPSSTASSPSAPARDPGRGRPSLADPGRRRPAAEFAASRRPPAAAATRPTALAAGSTPSASPPRRPSTARHRRARAARPAVGEADRRTVDRSAIVRLIVVAFVAMVAFAGFEATFSLLAERRFGLTLASTAAVFAVIGIVLVAVQGGLVGPSSAGWASATRCAPAWWPTRSAWRCSRSTLGWAGLIVVAAAAHRRARACSRRRSSSAVSGRAGASGASGSGWQQSAGGLARVVGPIVGRRRCSSTSASARPTWSARCSPSWRWRSIPSGPAPEPVAAPAH